MADTKLVNRANGLTARVSKRFETLCTTTTTTTTIIIIIIIIIISATVAVVVVVIGDSNSGGSSNWHISCRTPAKRSSCGPSGSSPNGGFLACTRVAIETLECAFIQR